MNENFKWIITTLIAVSALIISLFNSIRDSYRRNKNIKIENPTVSWYPTGFYNEQGITEIFHQIPNANLACLNFNIFNSSDLTISFHRIDIIDDKGRALSNTLIDQGFDMKQRHIIFEDRHRNCQTNYLVNIMNSRQIDISANSAKSYSYIVPVYYDTQFITIKFYSSNKTIDVLFNFT